MSPDGSRRRSRWAAPGVAVALALLAFASLEGCGGGKDSLILVTVSAADYTTSGLKTLVVSCGATTQVYHLTSDISTTSITVGLYVPSSVTGKQTVTAKAVSQSGQCGPGYAGSGNATITAAGATVTASIVMDDTTTCPSGGSGGSNGTGGTGGTGGSSTACTSQAQPPAGTPPAFNCCVEYYEVTPQVCGDYGTEVEAVAFSPDGKTLVTASGTDSVGNDVRIWSFDGHTPKATGTVLDSAGFRSLAFSNDGTLLAIPVSGGVDLWNTAGWSMNNSLIGSSYFFIGAAFTPDQTHIIAADLNTDVTPSTGNLYLFNLKAATPEIPVAVQPLSGGPEGLAVAAKAVNGQTGVAITYDDGSMDLFSYANGAFTGPTNVVVDSGGNTAWSVAFTPDGTLVAAGDSSSTIHFWSFPVPSTLAESGSEVTFSTSDAVDIVFALAFSPNGNYLAAGGGDSYQDAIDSRAALFSVASRAQFGNASVTATHDVISIVFSPAGNAVAGGELDCGTFFVCTN